MARRKIDLTETFDFEIHLPGGKTTILREPTVDDIELLNDREGDKRRGIDGFHRFLITLGMDKADMKNLSVRNLANIVESMLDHIGVKKS